MDSRRASGYWAMALPTYCPTSEPFYIWRWGSCWSDTKPIANRKDAWRRASRRISDLKCISKYNMSCKIRCWLVICSFLGNSPASDSGELPKKEQITFRTRRKLKNKKDVDSFRKHYVSEQMFSVMKLLKSKFRSWMPDKSLNKSTCLPVTKFPADTRQLLTKLRLKSSY